MDVAATYEQRAIDWLADRQDLIKAQAPTAAEVDAWLASMAAQFSWTAAPQSTALEHLEATLTETIAAIRQESDRRTRILLKVAIGKTSGAVTAAGIPALIATFGTASTGTPIMMLAGAAQTTAQLYWLGSLVGLGTAAGAIILTTTGFGVAFVVALFGVRWLFGASRHELSLQEHEKAILFGEPQPDRSASPTDQKR